MTKKKSPFVKQDNSSLEARDYSFHRQERDGAKGFFGQKITFLKTKVRYNMEATTLIWWLRLKNSLKGLFFGAPTRPPVQVITPVAKDAPPRFPIVAVSAYRGRTKFIEPAGGLPVVVAATFGAVP